MVGRVVGTRDVDGREVGTDVCVAVGALLVTFADALGVGLAGVVFGAVADADAAGGGAAEEESEAAGADTLGVVSRSCAELFAAADWQAVVPNIRSNAAAKPAICRLTVGSPPESASPEDATPEPRPGP